MLSVLRTIWILVILQIITTIRCQDSFGEQDILRLQQLAANDGKNTLRNALSFNTNLLQRDLNLQTVSSPSVQYQVNDDSNTNVNFGQRSPYTRNKKVYRIKNPFQNQVEETEREQENTETQDSANGASNQYASIQYSLPPEEFLQQFRAENQYYQQTQISTPAPNLGYTATPAPQPQYSQYSTVSPPNYDNNNNQQHYDNNNNQQHYDNNNNQQNNQLTLEPKASHGPTFLYSTPNTFLDNAQSTASPVPSYLSTPLNNGQYSSQPSYVSSASPIFVSSPSNQQTYVSSPLSIMQTGSQDYNNRVTSTMGNNPVNYDNNDYSSSRYPINVQQFQNDYSTTTTPSPYSNQLRDSWQNNVNTGTNAAPKSLQEGVYNQYQNYPYQNNQQDSRIETYSDNGETHRIGSAPAANNMYLNYVQPNNQVLNNVKLKARDLEHETSQGDIYSSGDFGWRLNGKRPLLDHLYAAASYPRYPPLNTGASDNAAVSKMNFHIDTSKPYNYDQISKSASENMDQEFANAAAKAHERFKQQQQQQQYQQQSQQYSNINSYGTNNVGTVDFNNQGLYYNQMDKQKNKYGDSNSNFYSYSNSQDLITSSPYFLSTPRDNQDNKPKQPFDHDKALKNIVPIDVSNVVGNSDPKTATSLDNNSRYVSNNYGTDQLDQNMRQYIRPVTDSYYKDKNTIYGFNIKTKGDDYSSVDNYKQEGSNIYAKQQQSQENNYNQGYSGASQSLSYLSQPSNNYQDNLQASSIQEQGLLRNHNQLPTDIASILKFSDIPYKLTQGLSNDALKFHNINYDQGGIPTPLPMRINQNVGSHQIDVTNSLLNKLFFNKPSLMNINKPEIDSQAGLMSTINGFKVANPFNVDLKLVAELLKGKPTVDDSHMLTLRDQYTKQGPIKLDLNSQLQHLLKSENNGNLAPINEGLSAIGSSYMDIFNNGRYPYQKYSRSQEEEESIIPIADASNTYPIGAVIEQDDTANEREVSAAADITAQGSDTLQNNFEENRPKTHFLSGSRIVGDRHRHPNLLTSGRHSYQRKHPKSDTNEPYPLLKPPPPHHSLRGSHMKMENRHNRRRRLHKPKLVRVIKTEPLFEAGAEPESLETSVPILMRPPPRVAEAKSDIDVEEATV